MHPPPHHPQPRRDFLRRALLTAGLPLLPISCAGRGAPQRDPAPLASAAIPPPPTAAPTSEPPAGPFRMHPAPDFAPHRILRFAAGLRPFRSGRIRLEAEPIGGKLLIHNYGHGGAGITLSWGSAEEAARLVREHTASRAGALPAVAVLGAGVIGLTTAHELLRAGHPVRIYTKDTLAGTTSWLAGAQWAPSIVARGHLPGDPGFFERLLRISHARFTALVERGGWGVFPRINYASGAGGASLRHAPTDLIPASPRLDALPIAGVDAPGRAYQTMLIEPPIFLPRLSREVESLGGTLERRTFSSTADMLSLPEPIIINCLGLGARDIANDARVIPIRGQLVHLQPQNLPYLLCHDDGYIFPRHDAVVLGGTVERGVTSTTPDEHACLDIMARNAAFFRAPVAPSPPRPTPPA